MTIRRATFFVPVLIVSLLHAAEPGIEFAGVLTAGGKTRIALTDTETKITTWVEPGSEFKGFNVARYDSKEEAVFLKKGGREIRLGLIAAKTPETPLAARDNAASMQAAATSIRSNLRQLVSAARQYQIERGVNTVSYADLVGPDKLIKELKPVAGENYSTLTFGPNVMAVSVTTANGVTISLDLPPPAVAGAAAPAGATQAAPFVPGSISSVRESGSSPTAGTPIPTPPTAQASSAPTTAATPTPNMTIPAANAATAAPPVASPTSGSAAATPAAGTASYNSDGSSPTGRQPVSPSYMIQGGDTWEKISAATGVPVTQLKQLNPSILEGSSPPAGQTIRVR
jgi:LysM repeat protein